ncbi:MAG: uroporphyrinogen decarboxylase family protein [Chloroflexota bacterium]
MGRSYTHRERVLATLNHWEADRIPLELGSGTNTTITLNAYLKLARHLGVEDPPYQMVDRMQQIVTVDERILRIFDIDFRPVFLGKPDGWTDQELPDGGYRDEWGIVRHKPQGSLYYDLTGSPLAGEISLRDVVNYRFPDPLDPGRYRGLVERVAKLRAETDYALILNVPPAFVHHSQYLRGFANWFMDLRLDPRLAGALMDACLEVSLATALEAIRLVGDQVDIIRTSDDIADQRGPVMSPALYRELLKPRQQRYMAAIRGATKAKIYYHSCGAMVPLLDDLIEIGVDIFNPVQVSAAGMDTAELKRRFGDSLTFMGAIDTQRVLPFGTTAEVETEVKQRIADLAPGGGYVLAAVHNIQPDVPPENIVAMYEAGHEFGRYPI